MNKISTGLIKEIKEEFNKLKPQKMAMDGNRKVTVKKAVLALAPAMERLKKRGYEYSFMVKKLQAKGIVISERTLEGK